MTRRERAWALVVARREQILYLVVGGWNTLFGYGVFALLYHLLHDVAGVPKIPGSMVALIVASVVGIANNYVLYRTVVFAVTARSDTSCHAFWSSTWWRWRSTSWRCRWPCMAVVQRLCHAGRLYGRGRSGQLPGQQVLQLRADSSRRMGVRCIQLSEQARRRGR